MTVLLSQDDKRSAIDDRYRQYAKGMFKVYDTNKDSQLDKEELKQMRRPPKQADANEDGAITFDEIKKAG